jgi:anti-sigma regulatory factor (Ser/Thr protein kinase)
LTDRVIEYAIRIARRCSVNEINGGERELGQRDLPNSTFAPSLARSFVTDVLSANGLDVFIEEARLLTSEAVTNAVVHANSASVVRVVRTVGGVRVSVSDSGGGDGEPCMRSPEPAGTGGGRGLRIIDRSSTRWGYGQSAAGTEVWFEIDGDR